MAPFVQCVAAMEPFSILVVDDDPVMGAMLHDTLEAWGFEVGVAEGLAQALAHLSERRFQAVVSDVHMPGPRGDGFDLLAAVGRRWPGTPVVLMSAFPAPETPERALEAGAAGFLAKPFHLSLLRETLDRALAAPDARRDQEGVRASDRR